MRTTALTTAILGAALLAGAAAAQDKKDRFDRPMRIGTFNLKDCFDPAKYEQVAKVKSSLEAEKTALENELKALQKKLGDLTERVSALSDKSSPLAQSLYQQAKLTEYELKMRKEIGQMALIDKAAGQHIEIYNAIVKATEAVAAEHKLDLVVRLEEPKLEEDEGTQAYLRRINQRVVFFRNPEYDITKEVLVRLNEDWKKSAPPATPAPSPAPSAAPTPAPTK